MSYEILLQMLRRFFAHTEETDAQLATLANSALALMLGAIKPLGHVLTTLPVGPDYSDLNAGPSFELFYESDYLFPTARPRGRCSKSAYAKQPTSAVLSESSCLTP